EVQCAAPELRVTLAWNRRDDPTPYHVTQAFKPSDSGDGRFQIHFAGLPLDPAWKGAIAFIAWRIDVPAGPVQLCRVGAPTAHSSALAKMLWQQWWAFQRIDASTINSVRAPHVLGTAPPAMLAL